MDEMNDLGGVQVKPFRARARVLGLRINSALISSATSNLNHSFRLNPRLRIHGNVDATPTNAVPEPRRHLYQPSDCRMVSCQRPQRSIAYFRRNVHP